MKKCAPLIIALAFAIMLSTTASAYTDQDLGLFPKKQYYYPIQPGQNYYYRFWLPPDLANNAFRLEMARRIAMDGFFRQFGAVPQIWPIIEETLWDADNNIATFSMTHVMVQGVITIEFIDPPGLAEPFGRYVVEAYYTAWDSPFVYRSTVGIVNKNRLQVWSKYQF